jgi:hypothetical protein
MPINFDREEFRKCLKEQFEYILHHECNELLEESLNEVVRERLHELAEEELNRLGAGAEDTGSPLGELAGMQIHLSGLDIDHRLLVRQVLKEEMRKLLKGFVNEHLA